MIVQCFFLIIFSFWSRFESKCFFKNLFVHSFFFLQCCVHFGFQMPSEVGVKAKLQLGMRGTMRGDRFGTPLVIVCCNFSMPICVNVYWRCWFPLWQKLTIMLKDVLLIIGIIRATVKLGTMATMVGGKKMGFDLKLTVEVKTGLNCWIYC